MRPQGRIGSVVAVSLLAVFLGTLVIAVALNGATPNREGAAVPPSASDAPEATGSQAAAPVGPVASVPRLVEPSIQRPGDLAAGREFGRTDAPATLVVWGDFQCPFCAKFARRTEPRLIADYVIPGKLRIVYRDWVFIGVESVTAAVAARCAADQDRFWPYHDYLLWNQSGENEGGFNDARLVAIAAAIGLDMDAFHLCTLDTSQIDAVRADTEAGTQAGIGMTPSLVVGDAVMPGAATSDDDYARLREVIDAAITNAAEGFNSRPNVASGADTLTDPGPRF